MPDAKPAIGAKKATYARRKANHRCKEGHLCRTASPPLRSFPSPSANKSLILILLHRWIVHNRNRRTPRSITSALLCESPKDELPNLNPAKLERYASRSDASCDSDL
ncbi:unnamed protein product [Cochlearia groenlandica]